MNGLLKRLQAEEYGAITILMALLFTTLLGLTAIAIDAGVLFLSRERLSSIADLAALSGSQFLPDDAAVAYDTVDEYLVKNGILPGEATIVVSPDSTSVEVVIERDVDFVFARVIGFTTAHVSSRSTARSASLSGVQGAAPLAVQGDSWTLGQQVQLKSGSGDGTSGWYGALALGGNGASTYEENLTNGYSEWIRIGDELPVKTGNMSGPTERAIESRIASDPEATYDNYSRNSSRLVVIPVVEDLDGNGHGDLVVTGFAMFFLENSEDCEYDDDDDEESECVTDEDAITGRFVRYVAEGESLVAGPNYGVRTIKLSE